MPSTINSSHTARIQQIAAGARVHRLVGVAAIYHRLADGQHQISISGRQFSGATLAEAIEAAKGGIRQ